VAFEPAERCSDDNLIERFLFALACVYRHLRVSSGVGLATFWSVKKDDLFVEADVSVC
jgi:hypothetical protein